jgi:hypothetical protein
MGADISVSGGNLSSPADWVELSASPRQVAISAGGAGDDDDFDVRLEVPTSEGNGAYSSTITFTVVAE